MVCMPTIEDLIKLKIDEIEKPARPYMLASLAMSTKYPKKSELQHRTKMASKHDELRCGLTHLDMSCGTCYLHLLKHLCQVNDNLIESRLLIYMYFARTCCWYQALPK